MDLEKLREKFKDNYFRTNITCPICNNTFEKLIDDSCPSCQTRLFEKDENGFKKILIKDVIDETVKYKVTGISSSYLAKESFSAGELVSFEYPVVSDSSVSCKVDGLEVKSSIVDFRNYQFKFLMAEHDMNVEVEIHNNMMVNTQPFTINTMFDNMMKNTFTTTQVKDEENDLTEEVICSCGTKFKGSFCPNCGAINTFKK